MPRYFGDQRETGEGLLECVMVGKFKKGLTMPERFQYLMRLDAHHSQHDRRYVRGSFAAAELQTVQLVITEDEFSNSRSPSIATKFDPMTSTAKTRCKGFRASVIQNSEGTNSSNCLAT